jgi:hypothetical protein
MSAVLVPQTIQVTYTDVTFSPPLVGPIATITAILTGTGTNVVSLTIPLAATEISTSLAPDTYIWTVTNFDAAGNTYGGPFTGSSVVTAPTTVTLSLASGLVFS